MFHKGAERAQFGGEVLQRLAAISEYTEKAGELLDVTRVGHVSECAHLFAVGAPIGWGDGVAEGTDVSGVNMSFSG